MASKKKLLQAAAGAAGGAGLDVDEVFSTYLYDGTGSNRSVVNGIDLNTEGGMVWIKNRDRSSGTDHVLFDTERGINKELHSNRVDAEDTSGSSLSAFNVNGFSINGFADNLNSSDSGASSYASWTWRKAPKFFDVVTWTGNSTSGRTVSHSLGSAPGMIIVKCTSETQHWAVYHRSQGATKYGLLSNTDAFSAYAGTWNNTEPTSTEITLGTDSWVNGNGKSYVAYLFAHNDGDGEFGPDGDADIIKCGSYTGNGSTSGPEINLGFEPQWILVKQSSASGEGWQVVDIMRGWANGSGDTDQRLRANDSGAEAVTTFGHPTATGFKIDSNDAAYNASSATYIYMAIRRGPLAEPESATDVFSIHDRDGEPNTSELNLGNSHLIDMVMSANRYDAGTTYRYITDRLRGDDKILYPSGTDAEITGSNYIEFDRNSGNAIPSGGYGNNSGGTGADSVFWQWKRAPSYFDVVAYTGNGSNRTITHNLGVAPEMMWLKERSGTFDWNVYHKDLGGADKYLKLNGTDAVATATNRFNNTHPTASVFSLGTSSALNDSGATHIAYLFATLAGVSKVGSYTGNGTSQNIDCGFSSGARFVLIKSSTQATEWFLFDTERGIVSGNDPALLLDTTDAEYTSYDLVDPYSSGFAVNYVGAFNGTNTSGQTYIFYAIA